MLVYKASSVTSVTIDWGDDLYKDSDKTVAIKVFENMVTKFTTLVKKKLKYKDEPEVIMCFTDGENFRKTILPSYKGNRTGKEKPHGYYVLKSYVEDKYKTYQRKGLEGDDCLGILQTSLKEYTVIISGDKDFKTVPGHFYDYLHNKHYIHSEEEANYWHFFQTLIGDTTDGYKGCPNIGKVKAKVILDVDASWKTIVKTFKEKGLTEKDALVQARVARILRASDYDFKKKKPILWSPLADK